MKAADKLRLMENSRNYSIFKILLILCLSFTLLLSQASKMHMHFVHDDHAILSGHANTHIVSAHSVLTLHDFNLTNHHGDQQSNHSANAVDISAEKLQNKVNLLDPLVLILLFICVFMYSPRLRSVVRLALSNTPFTSCYYLLQPPLRAPPIK